MSKEETFRRAVKIMSGEFENNQSPHLDEDELIQYQRGLLEPNERERVQSHLVHCEVCRAAFKDVSDFFQPAEGDETPISGEEIVQEWHVFRERLRDEATPLRHVPDARRREVWFTPRLMFALAATLFVAVALTTW